ncbi:hypothetical protein FAI41_04770 [Acetobacteraceae bacterium]|nr:hypothetical protein FAI41_04770 [Acetobacteraceae bacterium]
MTEDRVTRLEVIAEQTRERIDRVCQNQKELGNQVQQLLGVFTGIKKAIWGAGALAGTVGGGLFAYFPKIIHFLNQILNGLS